MFKHLHEGNPIIFDNGSNNKEEEERPGIHHITGETGTGISVLNSAPDVEYV